MKIMPVYALLLRQFYLLRSNPARFVQLFIWVAVDMVMWGFMTRYMNMISGGAYNFVPALLGAVLLWDLFIRIMQGVSMAYMEDSWSRNFLNIFASPLTVSSYLCGLVFSSILTSLVGLMMMLILATGVFGLSFFSYGIALLPFLLVIFLFGIAIGILGCALMLRLGPSGEWFIWPIPAVMSPFAAVFYPMSTLPQWMQMAGRLIPPSYVFENIRAIIGGGQASMGDLAIAVGLSLFYIMLASFAFTAVYKRALQSGQIARFAAETI